MVAAPAWPPRSAPRLFVSDELREGRIFALEGQQAHYLLRVMRIAPDDAVILCDNVTGEWAAKVTEADKRRVTVTVVERQREREEVPDLWLCHALLKKDRFDIVLEKATELGVRAIHPVLTRRCVADKLNAARAQTLIIEAAEQCARTALPELAAVQKLDALLRDWPADRALFFADELGGEPASDAFREFAESQRRLGPPSVERQTDKGPRVREGSHESKAAILIGPEGGFDDAERDAIRAHPMARAITLGPRILRGETAAIAAVSLWMGTVGDWSKV